MITGDTALGIAVFLFYLAMMLWGVFQTFWPSAPGDDGPGGGRRVRRMNVGPVKIRSDKERLTTLPAEALTRAK